jgi:hypothetical protein
MHRGLHCWLLDEWYAIAGQLQRWLDLRVVGCSVDGVSPAQLQEALGEGNGHDGVVCVAGGPAGQPSSQYCKGIARAREQSHLCNALQEGCQT